LELKLADLQAGPIVSMANKQELLRFLDQRVFDPILNTSAERYDHADRRKLNDVQDRTRSEKNRFHHYSSAREIIDNYKSDLHSSTAKRVNHELEQLKLRSLPSVEKDFLDAAGEK
jgi:hypothetical protein